LALVFASAPAFAAKKDDDYKKAQQAVAAGDVIAAAKFFCAVADEDPKYKDAATQCATYNNETKILRSRDNQRLSDARAAIKNGKLEDAEELLKKIKIPDLAEQAKDDLSRIATLRSEQSAAAAVDRNFQQAVQAYNSNDFVRAHDAFSGITGARAADARSYVDKINRYQALMSDARAKADAKDFKGAAALYQEAANIKADGPNDPRGNITQMNQLAAQAAAAAVTPPTQTNPTTTANTTPSKTEESHPTDTRTAAIKQPAPHVDSAKLLKEANAARSKGQIGAARGKYLAVLATDAGNAEARAGLQQMEAAPAGNTQSAGAEADVMLGRAIGEFYNGQFEESDVHIRDYLSVNGAKKGLAYFYEGASKVMRYYLGGAQDRQLQEEARSAFVKAKQAADFRPPDQKLVSPRVLTAYSEAK